MVIFTSRGRYDTADVDVDEDVYAYDRSTGEIAMISRPSQARNRDAKISPDGRFVAYGERDDHRPESEIVHITVFDRITGGYRVVGKDNGVGNPFGGIVDVADTGAVLIDNSFTVLGTPDPRSSTLVVELDGSVDNLPAPTIDGVTYIVGSNNVSLSGDGSTVAVGLGSSKIAAYDRSTNTYDVVSDPPGGTGNGLIGWTAISYTGRYVAFLSRATNLVPGAGGADTPYLFDRVTRSIQVVGPPESRIAPGSVSEDGRYVGFQNPSGALDPNQLGGSRLGDNNFLYVYDALSRTTRRVSEGIARTELTNFRFASAVGAFAFTTTADIAPADSDSGGIDTYFTEPFYGDTTPPIVEVSAIAPPANEAGWHQTSVTITWSSVDPTPSSGAPTQPAPSVVNAEGANILAESDPSCDPAGNCSRGTALMSIDLTPPIIAGLVVNNDGSARAPSAGGWYNSAVRVRWSCSDLMSGVATCPADSYLSADGGDLSASGTATDLAGNSATETVSGIKIDATAPTTIATTTCGASTHCAGNSINVTLDASDADSGVKSIHTRIGSGVETSENGSSRIISVPLGTTSGAQTISYWAVDLAGNVEGVNTAVVNYDNAPPTITHTIAPTPNAAGWSNTDTVVHWTATDDESGGGVASVSSDAQVTIETAGITLTGTAIDNTGNAATDSVLVKLDKTKPTIAGTASGSRNASGLYVGAVTVAFNCADALSGVVSCPSNTILTESGHDQSVTGAAIDAAGNSASFTVSGISIAAAPPTIATFTVAGSHLRSGDHVTGTAGSAVSIASITVTYTKNGGNGHTAETVVATVTTGPTIDGVTTYSWSASRPTTLSGKVSFVVTVTDTDGQVVTTAPRDVLING